MRLTSPWVLAVLTLALCVGSAAGAASQDRRAAKRPAPQTLVRLGVPIGHFAQDGDRLAWMTGRCVDYWTRTDSIAVRDVSGGRPQVLVPRVCSSLGYRGGLALAGERVLYWSLVEAGNNEYYSLDTAAPGSPPKQLEVVVSGPGFSTHVTGVGGDGDTLAYALVDVQGRTATAGRIRRIVGKKAVGVPKAPVSAVLAVAAGSIADAPSQRRVDDSETPPPAAVGGPVEIRDVRTGALRARFAPRGRVVELALDGESAAVLVAIGSARCVAQYDARSGRLLDGASVPGNAEDVDVAGANVVYRIGKAIWLRTGGRSAVVARASADPIGLSIEGDRIAWAENVGGRGRILGVRVG